MSARLIVHLRRYRTNAALTQAALADAVGVSRKTINTIENGVFTPSTILALTLAKALDCSVHDLFELPDEPA
ncbi:helix-turn-helix transcriptional regulator [Yoonia sp. BS5-3]|uniref:Helix-turn-helix transcriptional regulator n=1 Tax=Yoonia phaeophyticola TaxID=3137369 RepID=A0ABZ2V8M5_9RHOB